MENYTVLKKHLEEHIGALRKMMIETFPEYDPASEYSSRDVPMAAFIKGKLDGFRLILESVETFDKIVRGVYFDEFLSHDGPEIAANNELGRCD